MEALDADTGIDWKDHDQASPAREVHLRIAGANRESGGIRLLPSDIRHLDEKSREWLSNGLGGHPNPAIDGHLKTGQRRKHSGH